MRLPSISRSSKNVLAAKRLSVLTRAVCAVGMIGLSALATGCGTENSALGPTNSFLDPTELVKAKQGKDGQALMVPILDHLNAQDTAEEKQFSGSGKVTADDLVASSTDYVIGKNDLLTISITDLVGPGIESVRQVRVTESGKVSMPLVPQITGAGLTEAQLEQAIVAAYRDANLISNAQVSVTVVEARARTFTISGAISAPGEYAIIRSDFRLLDALALSKEVTSTTGIDDIYVIRRTSADAAAPAPAAGPTSVPTTNPGTDILAPHSESNSRVGQAVYLDDTTAPSTAGVGGMPAPGFMAGGTPATSPVVPDAAPAAPAAAAPMPASAAPTPTAATPTPTPEPAAAPAPAPVAAVPAEPAMPASPATAPTDQEGKYVVVDGKPVLVDRSGAPAAATTVPTTDTTVAAAAPSDFEFNGPAEPTDVRTIKIPLNALHRGELKYNIVIRPGDYIYVPQPIIGEYYMGGHVLRTGVYSLTARKITLKEAFISAGMLDPVAIPARTQIVRRMGDDKELFAVVDMEKIFAGTEPDIYLRPDDQVMVGTNIIAPFLAAIRNGFRITYGFGFLYDKNFEGDNNN